MQLWSVPSSLFKELLSKCWKASSAEVGRQVEKKAISEVLKAMNEISQGDVLQTRGDGAEARAERITRSEPPAPSAPRPHHCPSARVRTWKRTVLMA